MSIIWLLLLEALQRSFRTLSPCSKIRDDENNIEECVTTCHHVNANLDQLGNWRGGSCCPTSSHCSSHEQRWTRPTVGQRGMIEIQPSIPYSDPSRYPGNCRLARPLAQSRSLYEEPTETRLKTQSRFMAT